MSDNDVLHNDTPTESDKMDISEVSDQATPFSDRSPSEVIDNQEPDANAVVLDNAPAVAAAAAGTTTTSVTTTSSSDMSTPLTTDKLLQEKMLRATNMTSNHTTSKPIGVTTTTMANDKDSLSGKEQDLGNWSSAGEDTTLSREHSESKLSLEGLDLELPTLEMYQEEFVDFPSSPTHENFQPQLLVGERDSGNAGGSEEEEEDTSIYRAVLSPNCQDVRLRKEVAVGVASMVDTQGTTSAVLDNTSIATCFSSTLTAAITDVPLTTTTTVTASIANSNVTAATSSVDSFEDDKNRSQRKVLSPNPEDTQLPDIGGIPVTVVETTEELPRSTAFHKSMESLSGMKTILSTPVMDDGSGDEGNSDFVFERRDSKRLSRYALGERVMEGLFVESRNKDSGANSGLRKISVPDEVMNSPESDSKDLDLSIESPDGEVTKKQPLVRKFPPLGPTNSDPGPGKPVPAARSKPILWDNAIDYRKMTSPPCPKPRRKNRMAVPAESFKHEMKGPQLLLNPLTLDSQTSIRRVAKVNPDGTVEVEERPGSLISSQRGGRRRIRVTADILSGHAREDEDEDPEDGDASSIGGHSSRLSDADLLSPGEDDADLDALLSPGVDTPDELEDSILERLGEPPPMTTPAAAPIPELTAAEERVESRNWRSCVVQGIERRIDMKVIEPYKRVLSHGGYLTAGSHNAIIVFSACFLPDRSRVDYDYVMDNLFLYVLTTLDQLITEDYVLIYLHGATQRSCMPTFTWLKRCYQLIDRRLRKNLKGLYLVHPTFWLKTIVLMTKPFISSKFSRKLRFVDNLAELAAIVPLEQASIPDRVKQLDDELEERAVKRRSLLNWWWMQTPDTTTVSS